MDDQLGCIIGVFIYLYLSVCIYCLADKTGADNRWFAFLPILDAILLLDVAEMPLWWLLLLFIPVVNVIAAALIWMSVARVRGKPPWVGILVVVPGINLFVLGYLAWA